MSKKSRTLGEDMEDTKKRHRLYMRAIQHPLRRDILRAIENGAATLEDLEKELDEDRKVLDWHFKALEQGFCIEREGDGPSPRFVLTKEGKIVGYLDRKASL